MPNEARKNSTPPGLAPQARYPCASSPFRLLSAPLSCAGWAVLTAVATKNAPANFDRSEVDILKFFDG